MLNKLTCDNESKLLKIENQIKNPVTEDHYKTKM